MALCLFGAGAGAAHSQACEGGAPQLPSEGRFVTCADREDGSITAIGDFGASWSPRSRTCAVADIADKRANYFVDLGDANAGERYRLETFTVSDETFIRARSNNRTDDNLAQLPSCSTTGQQNR